MCWKASFFAREPETRAKGRDALLLRAPPGHDRSCQEASEQEGAEAEGIPQRAPSCRERSPGRQACGSPTVRDVLPLS